MFGISKEEKFKKKFESITQAMVSLAFEYVAYDIENVNGVYVFCSNESNQIHFNAFFEIDGELLKKHKVNTTGRSYNVSDITQTTFSKCGTQDLRELVDLFSKYGKEPPTLIKMEFYPKSGKFDCNMDYEAHYSDTDDKTAHDVAESWFNELKLKIESNKAT